MKWIEAKDRPKPKHKDTVLVDGWQFDNRDISPLEKWSIADLNSAIEMVEKHIENQIKFLDNDYDAFIQNGELYIYERIGHKQYFPINARDAYKYLTVRRKYKKSKEKLFTENQIRWIKNAVKELINLRARREVLAVAKTRKVFGKEYFKMEQVKKEMETLKDYEAVMQLKKKNLELTDKEIFELVAEQTGKKPAAIKSNYYIGAEKKQKLQKKL